jgi:hypothetical protein
MAWMGKLKEVDNLGRSKYKGNFGKISVKISVDFHILPYIYIYIYKKKKQFTLKLRVYIGIF